MSYDVFLRGFAGGAAAPGRPDAAVQVLAPYFAGTPADGYTRVRLPDGEADVYGVGRASLMISRASGEQIWDLIVSVAVAADWVIMPAGCPVCVVAEAQSADLPDELRADVSLVGTGADLLQIIRST